MPRKILITQVKYLFNEKYTVLLKEVRGKKQMERHLMFID